jgi:hypothetical protein
MTLQSSAHVSVGLADEPPVSPPSEEKPPVHAIPMPAAVGPLRPPLEAELVQAGKLSMGQLAQAHRDRLETGKQILDIIVERGWVSAREVAVLRAENGVEAPAEQPSTSEPEPATEPEPELAPAAVTTSPPAPTEAAPVATEPEPELAPAAVTISPPAPTEPGPAAAEPVSTPTPTAAAPAAAEKRFIIAIRLISGELIEAGETDDEDKAAALGHAVIADVAEAGGDEWPFFAGRYIRPEAIVSIDLLPAEPA